MWFGCNRSKEYLSDNYPNQNCIKGDALSPLILTLL
jgi:hypothetical protein